MTRRIIASLVAGAAGLALLPSSASALIQVQRGIAGVPLNATQAQMRTALGTPTKVRHGRNDFSVFTEYQFAGGIKVFFQGNMRVTSVSTTGLGDRTARGIGVGSSESAVKQRVAGVHCTTEAGFRHCQVGQSIAGHRVTDFAIRQGRVTRVTVGFVID
jgi:hypothetical protein